MSKNKEVLKNIGLSIIYKPIGIIITLILIPITIKYLGNSIYGLWATILSIISWINLFDIGIGNGLRNKLTAAITQKNYILAKEYIGTAYVVIGWISLLIFFLFTIVFNIFNWNNIFNTYVYTNKELYIIMIVNLMFISLNFVLKLVTIIYYSLQESSIVGIMQISNQILNLLGIYVLLKIEYSYVLLGISIVYGGASLIINLIFSFILFYKNQELIPNRKSFKKEKIKSLTDLGIKFFIMQIAAMVVFTTDNLIITKLFGPEEVTPYTITFKIFSIIIMIHGIVITPIWSAITKAYAEYDIDWIEKTLKKLNVFWLFIVIGTLILYCFYPYLLKNWMGTAIVIPQNLILMFAFYAIISTFCNNYAYIFNGMGEIELPLKIGIVQGIINIPLSIYFAKVLNMGSSGVILGTNVTLLLSVILFPAKFKQLIKKLKEVKNGE